MAIKIDTRDKKILSLLDENSRYSSNQIAKKVRLSKPAVIHRIKNLEKKGIILNYYAAIEVTKLGYSQYKLYFKFQNATLEDEKKIIDYWIRQNSSVWVASTTGKWNLAVSILSKSNHEFGKTLGKFMETYGNQVLEKEVLLTEYSPIYSRDYLLPIKSKSFVYGIPEKIIELDDTDKKILSELSKNARIPIFRLMGKTKLTRDVIKYRMKKLEKEGILCQYRCYPNLEKIGIQHYKLTFCTNYLSKEWEKKLNEYVSQHKKATQMLKLIGSWDIEVEFETESENELICIMAEMRKEFSRIIRDYDFIRITKTHKLNFFPFGSEHT